MNHRKDNTKEIRGLERVMDELQKHINELEHEHITQEKCRWSLAYFKNRYHKLTGRDYNGGVSAQF